MENLIIEWLNNYYSTFKFTEKNLRSWEFDDKREYITFVWTNGYCNWGNECIKISELKQHKYKTVLAEIVQVTDLGIFNYFEVVQMNMTTKEFESYSGSDTFEDGKTVKRYVPVQELQHRFVNWRKHGSRL